MIKSSDFRLKDVINISDGKKLGSISDIEFDVESGKVTSIVVPSTGRFLGFFNRGEDIIIPWEKINKIGTDVILVNIFGVAEIEK
ncbi:YlmC/YmxH family sporulation protein [Anaerosinus massiliensis]|uniref:YlmC/YmxH family sporulation protein n=1 Tax=Massilibacillus massiliensis TaxID=1806837 RepID=UPI000DA63798|nr:YlmC/YmxH family sporulation protein [Massilibacillus massiliensis]